MDSEEVVSSQASIFSDEEIKPQPTHTAPKEDEEMLSGDESPKGRKISPEKKKQTQNSSKSAPKDAKQTKKDQSRNKSETKQKSAGMTDEISSVAHSEDQESKSSSRVTRRGQVNRESQSESAGTTKGDKKKSKKSKKSKKDKKRKKSGKKKKSKKRRFNSDSSSSNSSSDSSDSSQWSLNDKDVEYGSPEKISDGSDQWEGRS
jgi:hypothetical protein